MDTKRLVGPILIMMGLVFLWKLVVTPYLEAHYPDLAKENQPIAESTTAPSTNSSSTASNTTNPTTSSAVATTGHGFDVVGSESGKAAELGSISHNDPTYSLGIMIDPLGAGLSSVTLNRYFQTDQQTDLYAFQKPLSDDMATTRALSTQSITVDGNVIDLSNVAWTQKQADSTSATYVATVREGGEPILELNKVFQVFPASEKSDGPDGYEVRVQQDFRNLTNRQINVKVKLNGTLPPASENERGEDRQFLTGYDDGYSQVGVEHTMLNEVSKSKPTKDLTDPAKGPLLWTGSGNAYFNAIIRPEYAGLSTTPPVKIAALTASARDVNATKWQDQHASMTVETNEFKLDPHADAPLNLRVFFGPKQRELLKNAYYSAFPLHYDNTLVITSGFCGFLTFTWLINTLYFILWCFHWVTHDWGLAIIGLVCLVRLILHPITKKSQVNMMQMGKMGPEIERLKKKYGDDKDGLNKAMVGVYKDQGLTPILGCLPMLLQTPIWIALWSALQSTFELRQASFLRFNWPFALHLTWIKDLSEPDKLISFPHDIPLLFFSINALNVLPLLLAVVFYVQQKMQPVPATQTPEQEQQRKMMMWMGPLLFPIMLYKGPSGLALYILTSTTIGIFENKIIRKHIKDKEEAEKAGRIIVDAKPTRGSKRRRDDDDTGGTGVRRSGGGPKKPGGVMGWLADLQAKAEQVRREAEKRKT
jgi:YidC/Oxa1 family membrane protein insertase